MPKTTDTEHRQDPRQDKKASVAEGSLPVFLEGEDRADYDQLLVRVMNSVTPRDYLEELWVEDVAYLVWEARRLRRLKDHLLRSSARHGLREILEPLMREIGDADALRSLLGSADVETLIKAWYANDPSAQSQVNALLQQAGLTMHDVMAQTLALKLNEFERINRMIEMAQVRRDAVLREVDRHRKTLAAQLERAIEKAEFEEAPPPTEPQRHQYG